MAGLAERHEHLRARNSDPIVLPDDAPALLLEHLRDRRTGSRWTITDPCGESQLGIAGSAAYRQDAFGIATEDLWSLGALAQASLEQVAAAPA